MTMTTTTDRPQPRPLDPRPQPGTPGLTGPVIPVPAVTHPAGDLVHPWID
ncbi:hypothetical protein [Cellulomonas shaoxiangyii]|nr:hypothetical protein [Cellulomonas shaoxiangyii]